MYLTAQKRRWDQLLTDTRRPVYLAPPGPPSPGFLLPTLPCTPDSVPSGGPLLLAIHFLALGMCPSGRPSPHRALGQRWERAPWRGWEFASGAGRGGAGLNGPCVRQQEV